MSAENMTLSDDFGLDTWNRPRSIEELRNFVNARHSTLPDSLEVE
jgi:hypothetical protein